MMTRSCRYFILCIALFSTWFGLLVTTSQLGMSYLVPAWKKNLAHSEPSVSSAIAVGTSIDTLSRYTGSLPVHVLDRGLPERVIIMASMRTGSSFVGELLGNSQDIFYLFEPGHGLQLTLNDIESKLGITYNVMRLYLNMLPQLFQCDFRNLDFYLKFLSKQSMEILRHRAPRLYDACRRQSKNGFYCTVTQRMATESCKKSKYIVVKSIRIPLIRFLLPMVKDMSLKVIHLVRDPRPMTASRALALTGQKMTLSTTNTSFLYSHPFLLSDFCRFNIENLKMGRQAPIMQQRYMFLRYEEAASDPTLAAERIYKFLGRNRIPESVLLWIDAHTKVGSPGQFSTTRNSSQVYQAWRHTLSFDMAKEIEGFEQCGEMMTSMGYCLLEDERHQRDLFRSLIDSVPSVIVPATS